MVSFAEDSKDLFEIPDPPTVDFSFADSFLDFDSIQHWFDDKSPTDMAPLHDNTKVLNSDTSIHMIKTTVLTRSDPVAIGSADAVNVEVPEREKLVTLGDSIEEGMGKISLVGGFEDSFGIVGNVVHNEVMADERERWESESSSTSSSPSSSSTSSASSCSSGSGSSSDDDNEEREHSDKKGEGETEVVDEELEEGEIRDSDDSQELDTKTAAVDDGDDEDVEKMLSWSGMNDDDAEDDEDDDASGRPIRSKNELEALAPVPQVDVALEPHHQMLPVGVVMSIMGAKVIVEGLDKHDPLDEGSILWMPESQTPLGFVDEVFGPVRNPYYVVRYNSENEVPAGIYEGTLISFVPEFADHVLNKKDLYKKGCDASGVNDEEVTDESEFSDDEKEAEYRRMQKLTKRGIKDQNPGNRKNNRKKVPVKARAMPAIPLLNHGNCPPLSAIGPGHDGANTIAPSFPPTSVNPHTASNEIQTTGASLLQPQPALLPNGFPANVASWFSQKPHNPYQFPLPEIPFQQQFKSSQGSLSTKMFRGVLQPTVFAQPTYTQGLVGQNQMPLGLSSHSLRFQPPICAGEQGILFNQMQLERNHNMRPSTISGNSHVPGQFHPGASAGRGRKTFHRGGRKGWRPVK